MDGPLVRSLKEVLISLNKNLKIKARKTKRTAFLDPPLRFHTVSIRFPPRNHGFLINVGDVKGAVVDSALRQRLATKHAPRVVELGTFVGYGTLV